MGGKLCCRLLYSFVAYRAEWRYSTSAHRVALIDAGHVVQNLYLACEAIGCGTCAVAAIDQAVADGLCRLDGKEEFIIYAAPAGLRIRKKPSGQPEDVRTDNLESNAVKPLENKRAAGGGSILSLMGSG